MGRSRWKQVADAKPKSELPCRREVLEAAFAGLHPWEEPLERLLDRLEQVS